MNTKKLTMALIYLYIIGVYLGPEMLAINVGSFHLFLIRLIQPIFLLMCTFKILTYVNHYGLKLPLYDNTFSLLFLAGWLGYAILSGLWASNYYSWLRGSYLLFGDVLLVLTFSLYVKDIKDIKNILMLIMVMSIFHLCIGYYEIVTGQYHFIEPYRVLRYRQFHYPVSGFYNVNDYAKALLVGIYSSFAIFITTRSNLIKWLSAVATILMTAMCIYTRSRGIILGTAMSFFAMIMISKFYRRKLLKLLLYAVLLSIMSVFIISMVFKINVIEILKAIVNEVCVFEPQKEEGSDLIRIYLILNGLAFLKQNVLMGTGIGCIEDYMLRQPLYNTYDILNIHNWWFEILVSCGIFVFAGYIIFYVRLIKHMFKSAFSVNNQNTDIKGIGTCLGAFLLAYIIACISSSSNLGARVDWLYFAIIIAWERLAVVRR